MKNTLLQETIEIAKQAGEILRSYWGKLSQIRKKQYFWDLVSEADLASEAYILAEIKKRFPNDQILSEEAGLNSSTPSPSLWLIDPLDGTTNFTHQYPMVSISIGLWRDQKPLMGIVYNPIFNELFYGYLGEGAFLNDQPIHVSKMEKLDQSLLSTGFAYDRKETQENNYAEFCYLTNLSQGVRRGGSAAIDLAYVAAGRLDGYWERGLKPWDTGAGVLLVKEAGGLVTSYENGVFDLSTGRILATNGLIHQELSRELQSVANNHF